MMALERRDLIFPSDVFHDTQSLFVRIRDPKTARFARRQRGRIDDESIIWVAQQVFGSLSPDTKLFPWLNQCFSKAVELHYAASGSTTLTSRRGCDPRSLTWLRRHVSVLCFRRLELGRLARQMGAS